MRLFAGLIIGLFLVLTLMFLAAESQGWMSAVTVTHWIEAAQVAPAGRWLAAGLVIALLAADLVLPVPSSVVMTLSGAILGWTAGTAASFIGSMASALVGFALCRRYGQRAFERLVGRADSERIGQIMNHYGTWGLLLSRSVPMLTEVVSCVAGLSRMPARTFAALAAAGTLPICMVYAWAGTRGAVTGSGWAVLLAFAIPALGFLLVRRLNRQPRPR
ncbi:MAG: VTT domain-containing protein [Lentisphaerae bacterium]|nr:VTT domain-containing protein [Lentisphaerota bacterium]